MPQEHDALRSQCFDLDGRRVAVVGWMITGRVVVVDTRRRVRRVPVTTRTRHSLAPFTPCLECPLSISRRPRCGAFQTQPANVLLYGFAGQAAKYTMKMVRREAGNPREIVECENLVEMPLDMDQRAQDALVVSGGGRVFHTARGRFPAIEQAPVRNAGYSRYPAPISE